MINNKTLFIIYGVLVAIITIVSAAIITEKNKEIENLISYSKDLSNLNVEYRWQLEQVPLIMESVRDSWCNGE